MSIPFDENKKVRDNISKIMITKYLRLRLNTFNVLHRLVSWFVPSLELLFSFCHYGPRGEGMGYPLSFLKKILPAYF